MTLQKRLELILERGFDLDGSFIIRKDQDGHIEINEIMRINDEDFMRWLSGFEIVKREKKSWSKKELIEVINRILRHKGCTITSEELNKFIF